MQTAQPMLSSPLKWVGGKSKSRKEIIKLIPADAECFVEAFAGAGWVLFGKAAHPIEVLNDKNGDLVNLWRVLKHRPAELLERVQQNLYSRENFLALRETRPDVWDEMGRAEWLYLLIQQSFGADVSRTEKARFGFWNKSPRDLFLNKSLDQFAPAYERLRGVFIENLDFADLIKRYDQPRTVFFCDPPYLDTCGYAESFSLADHERLAETLRGIEGRFLLTINDHQEIRKLYDGMVIQEKLEARALSNMTEGRVAAPILFIANYDIDGRCEERIDAPARSEFSTGLFAREAV